MSGLDPYTYPGSEVLRNKLEIRDSAELARFEYRSATVREVELFERPHGGGFDLDHLQRIHRHLFQDVYPWAGELRSVSIVKGNSMFAWPDQIESYGKQVFAALGRDGHLKGLEKDRFTARLSHHFSEINALHPFREGNGRSTRVFLHQLAREAGNELNFTKADPLRWNDASRVSFMGDLGPAKALFSEITIPARALAFEQMERREALVRYPELEGAFLTLDATREYAARELADPIHRAQLVEHMQARVVGALLAGTTVSLPDIQAPIVKAKDSGRER